MNIIILIKFFLILTFIIFLLTIHLITCKVKVYLQADEIMSMCERVYKNPEHIYFLGNKIKSFFEIFNKNYKNHKYLFKEKEKNYLNSVCKITNELITKNRT